MIIYHIIYEHPKNILATQVVEELGSSVKEGLASLPTKEEVKDDKKDKVNKIKGKRTTKTKANIKRGLPTKEEVKDKVNKIKGKRTKKTKANTKRRR